MYDAGAPFGKSVRTRKPARSGNSFARTKLTRVTGVGQTTIRRLGPGDEDVVRRLASGEPQTVLLADDRTIFLAAFQGADPVGFVFGYELLRRHGNPSILFVYEVEVDEACRGQGVATKLLRELEQVARARGIRDAFVLTEPDNDAANGLYASLGGTRVDTVMWDFDYA
jgi:ribosomal protein S18 acetylase RimI-like enzyme